MSKSLTYVNKNTLWKENNLMHRFYWKEVHNTLVYSLHLSFSVKNGNPIIFWHFWFPLIYHHHILYQNIPASTEVWPFPWIIFCDQCLCVRVLALTAGCVARGRWDDVPNPASARGTDASPEASVNNRAFRLPGSCPKIKRKRNLWIGK